MRALLGLILALYVGLAEARFPRGTPSSGQIFYNIVTDGGATCNGVADDAPNFKAFNTWAIANQGNNQVVLTIPTGSNCIFNSSEAGQLGSCCGVGNTWTIGINDLVVEGSGATISEGTSGFWLGAVGVCERGLADANGCSARLQTVSAGSTTITLTPTSLAAGYITRFPIGQWVMLGGVDLQGEWNNPYGFPPNQHFFEYRQITNVDVGTGVITLDRPLTNAYLSTWPNYNSGNGSNADQGGPATIWAVGLSGNYWGASLEFRGVTFNVASNQIYAATRFVTYRNVTFTGLSGAVPTQNELWACYSCIWSNASAQVEVDKQIGTVVLDDVTLPRIDFQSSSTDLLVLTNSSIGSMFGSPKASQVTDTSFTLLRIGAYSYGISTGNFVCTRCDATTFELGGIAQDSRNPSEWAMSSGEVTIANTDIAGAGPLSRIMVPGGNVFFTTNGATVTSLGSTFQVTDLTQDPTYTYIQSSLAGTQPPIGAFTSASYVTFRTISVPRFTCTDCTGDTDLVAISSQKGAPALIPPKSYAQVAYAPTTSGQLEDLPVFGNVGTITIDVTQAYTGTGNAVLSIAGQFNNAFTIKQSDWTQYTWGPTINLKQTGTRVITGSTVTCNGSPGACSGDTNLTLPEAVWIQSGFSPYMQDALSGGGTLPLFTITAETNQQVVP